MSIQIKYCADTGISIIASLVQRKHRNRKFQFTKVMYTVRSTKERVRAGDTDMASLRKYLVVTSQQLVLQ